MISDGAFTRVEMGSEFGDEVQVRQPRRRRVRRRRWEALGVGRVDNADGTIAFVETHIGECLRQWSQGERMHNANQLG